MDICGDNRFEIIEKAKKHLFEATNIDTSEDEMKVLDDFLFRCWQMGWLDRYDEQKKGKWIKEFNGTKCVCSICGYSNGRKHNDNYCPHCGTHMVSEQTESQTEREASDDQ